MGSKISVVIADDDAVTLENYKNVINYEKDLEVVGTATDGLQAIQQLHEREVDVLVMDMNMPFLDGISASERLTKGGAVTRILMLTVFDQPEDVQAAIAAGVSGFIVKNGPIEDLLKAIRVLHEGKKILSPEVTAGLFETVKDISSGAEISEIEGQMSLPIELTPRERELIQLIAEGRTNHEIATQLFLSEASVKTYVSRLRNKLNARSRAELVTLYYENIRISKTKGVKKVAKFGSKNRRW